MPDQPLPDLPPLHSEDFLPPMHRWMTLGGIFLVSMLGGSIVLAAVVRYNVTVQAPASVRPSSELVIVQSAIRGTIREIRARQNQTIQQGDVLAEFATTDRTRLRNLEERRNRLQTYLRQYENQLADLDQQLKLTDREIVALTGLAPVSNEQQPSPETYIEAALQILAKTNATAAQTLTQQRDRLLRQRAGLMNQLRYDQDALLELELELNQQVIRAPSDGTILKLGLNNPGQTIQPGDLIAQNVPRNVPLVVKARVFSQDISKVQVGQAVQLRVSAYPYPDFGILKGSVQAIAPDVITVQDSLTGGFTPYYEVTIQPEKPYLLREKRQYPLQPGMEVTADIISGQETVLQLFLRRLRLWTDL